MFKNLLIGVAVFGLGWGASFAAGTAWGRRSVAPPVQAQVIPAGQFGAPGGAAVTAPGAGGGAAQGAPAGGQAGQARGATAGTVERVEGQTLVVAGPGGQQTRVTLTGATQISKQASGTPEDLAPGTRVAVVPQGQPAGDGTVTAASVSILPEGAPQPGQGGQAGQGGQGAPGAPRRPGG